ncbi:B-cell receptor-associated protein 29 [Geodia barretti]|uniref:Endoplasmic reticulum transmembrane protein n=1 Tax=Geodia barretti TaxID=519541 RepID=A0AA35RG81_GEOBA|nr:B-cell receptor-associated protein 29 [Geodia barretti]
MKARPLPSLKINHIDADRSCADSCQLPVASCQLRDQEPSVMSVQWFAVATLLYVELAITLLLLIPFLKPATWKKILNLPFFGAIKPAWTTIFYATLLILIVLFADSIRTMRKYGDVPETKTMTLDAKLDYRLKECRGQRNFYISGFTLFLILVIRRLVMLIYQRAHLEAEVTALKSQAAQASRELQRRLQQDTDTKGEKKEKPEIKKAGEEEEETVETVGPSQEGFDRLQEGNILKPENRTVFDTIVCAYHHGCHHGNP